MTVIDAHEDDAVAEEAPPPEVVEVTDYYDSGAVREVAQIRGEELHGEVVLHREDGSIECRSHFNDGLLDGTVETFDERDELIQTADYVKGQLDGEVVAFENRRPTTRMTVRGGKQEGPTLTYDAAGRVTGRFEFVGGLQEGVSTWYGQDAGAVRTSEYEAGHLHGPTVDYLRDGKIHERTPYVEGLIHGEVITYDLKGEVDRKVVYEEGVPVEGGKEGASAEDDKRESKSFFGGLVDRLLGG